MSATESKEGVTVSAQVGVPCGVTRRTSLVRLLLCSHLLLRRGQPYGPVYSLVLSTGLLEKLLVSEHSQSVPSSVQGRP